MPDFDEYKLWEIDTVLRFFNFSFDSRQLAHIYYAITLYNKHGGYLDLATATEGLMMADKLSQYLKEHPLYTPSQKINEIEVIYPDQNHEKDML